MLTFEVAYPDKCFRLNYEAVCAKPLAQIKPLFAFLGESWETSMLEFHHFPHDRYKVG
jgi:hypothetical protein